MTWWFLFSKVSLDDVWYECINKYIQRYTHLIITGGTRYGRRAGWTFGTGAPGWQGRFHGGSQLESMKRTWMWTTSGDACDVHTFTSVTRECITVLKSAPEVGCYVRGSMHTDLYGDMVKRCLTACNAWPVKRVWELLFTILTFFKEKR